MPTAPERIVLVTGASRGIGAEVAKRFAEPGTHVVVNYRENTACADSVAEAIRRAGGQACTFAADIADEADTAAMIAAVRAHFGRLDALVLNASGGLDSCADPGCAMRLNRDAQKRLATAAMGLMPAGSRIVYVTSHQAHFFPDKAVPKGYATFAVSKRAGETALYAMRSELDHAGIGFTVVSGEMADSTAPVGAAGELASAIVRAATTAASPGIVYVGGADYLMTA